MNEHSLRPTTMRIGQKFSGHHSLPDLIAKTQKIKHNKKISFQRKSAQYFFLWDPDCAGGFRKNIKTKKLEPKKNQNRTVHFLFFGYNLATPWLPPGYPWLPLETPWRK